MTFTKTLIIVAFLLMQMGRPASASEIFGWLDDDGTPHFTNIPSRIPPVYRDRAEVLSVPDLPRVKPLAPLVSIKPPPKRDLHGHDERWWREQVHKWQSRKEEMARRLAELDKKLGRLRFENKTVFSKEAETGRLLREIEKMKQEIRKAEEVLQTALPEEARKAGAPPGWLR